MSDLPWDYPTEPVVQTAKPRIKRAPDPERQKRGRTNRARGNRHELAVARKYGGLKVGPLGRPTDVIGAQFVTQVKTHQRLAPREWTVSFAGLAPSAGARCPRLIVRYLRPGVEADDYVVIRGSDWLNHFGRDE